MPRDTLDLHTHTLASGHAYSTIREMIDAAQSKGLKALGITEHAPQMEGTCTELYFQNLRIHPRQYGDLRVLFGVELNILDPMGHVDLSERTLQTLDYAVASIHSMLFTGETLKEHTDACIRAMELPKVKILGHPDDNRAPMDYERLVPAAVERGVFLEVNNASLQPSGFRKGARENLTRMLSLCERLGAQVVINSDAHVADLVGDHASAWALLDEIHFPEELIINSSLERFLAVL